MKALAAWDNLGGGRGVLFGQNEFSGLSLP